MRNKHKFTVMIDVPGATMIETVKKEKEVDNWMKAFYSTEHATAIRIYAYDNDISAFTLIHEENKRKIGFC